MKQPLTMTGIGLLTLLSISLVGCAPPATPAPTAEPKAEPIATATLVQAETSDRWDVVLQTKVEQPVRMAAFLNDTFGLTGGADSAGKAHYTADGGQIWTMAESSSG
jgi:hypothetical protein